MPTDSLTVEYALRWLRKLEQLESEGVKAIHVRHLMQAVAKRCAEIADAEATHRENDNPGWSAADSIATAIREEFHL